MYRCGNKVEIGDCIEIQVDIEVREMKVQRAAIAVVLEANHAWSAGKNPLLTIKMSDDSIRHLPSSWCTLCQRK